MGICDEPSWLARDRVLSAFQPSLRTISKPLEMTISLVNLNFGGIVPHFNNHADGGLELRRNLNGSALRMDPMNLGTHQLRVAPENVLIVASAHDLYAPLSTLEDLQRHWAGAELWRTRHGHISAMASAPVMERTVRWVVRRTRGGRR